MTQFINKSIIKVEIERLVKEYRLSNSAGAKYRCEAYGELLDFINSLQEEPVSEDLEKAARSYTNNIDNICGSIGEQTRDAFKEGAQWQKQQDQSTLELAEDHAYLAGQEKVIDKACEWLKENKDHPFIKCEDPCLSGYLTDEFIEDFKKVMEE